MDQTSMAVRAQAGTYAYTRDGRSVIPAFAGKAV